MTDFLGEDWIPALLFKDIPSVFFFPKLESQSQVPRQLLSIRRKKNIYKSPIVENMAVIVNKDINIE